MFAVYGIWENLAALEIVLQDMPMICPQLWEFSKITQDRKMSTFFQRLDFAPNCIKGRHVVSFWDLSEVVFLEVQNQQYS